MAIFNINGKELLTGGNHYRTFSVLSDSYSAYADFVEPSDNAVFFPNDYVTTVDEMWWHLFAESYGSVLQKNNSYSGSRIAIDQYQTSAEPTTTCFIARMKDIGKPELIFILGGTNDSWNGVQIGDFKYSDWTDDDLKSFRPAVAYMLDYLLHHNVGAKIVFLLNRFQSNEDDYFTSIKTICAYYDVDVIDLSSISKMGNHPDVEGMKTIRDKIMEHFGETKAVVKELESGWSFPYSASSDLNFVDLSQSFEQYKYYRFELDGVVSSSDAYFELRADTNTTFAKFPAGQNGKAIVEAKASQHDATSRMCIRCIGGTGIVNNLKIYEVSFDV